MEECIEETASICVPRLRQGIMITKPQHKLKHKVREKEGGGAVQNKDPQQETSTEEENTDVREEQPEPEVAQNEDQQQEGQTEEDVESETQSGPNVQQTQENK